MSPRERFLLNLLAGVFSCQIAMLSFAVWQCSTHGGLKVCPRIGERYDTTFAVIISTTLALLTGIGGKKPSD